MLVLTRRELESLVIIDSAGAEITVTVNSIDNNKVRLGLQAPKSVRIMRTEVAKQLERAGLLPKWKAASQDVILDPALPASERIPTTASFVR